MNDSGTQRPRPGARSRMPSPRASAALAVAMLTLGVGVGAAIGPAPATSLAGSAGVVQRLPALIASLAARSRTQQPAAPTAAAPPPATTPQATPAASGPTSTPAASTPASTTPAASTTPSETESKSSKPRRSAGGKSKVPPITSVWLIELSGSSFAEATSNAAAAPYITGQLIPNGTLLSGWSALSASAFAGDAALVEHRATLGGTPPVLHTIVQPACAEGEACAPGTPAGIAAADRFAQAALASIEQTTAYSEHGLVVVTYATVADATSAELPAGAASATLGATPPAGALLVSPFAKAGASSSVAFDPTSPMRSVEALLR